MQIVFQVFCFFFSFSFSLAVPCFKYFKNGKLLKVYSGAGRVAVSELVVRFK